MVKWEYDDYFIAGCTVDGYGGMVVIMEVISVPSMVGVVFDGLLMSVVFVVSEVCVT